MIKVLAFIRRRPDLDLEAFRSYYEAHHAPLVSRLLPFYIGYRRNYLERSVREGGAGLDFDVVTELEFAGEAEYEAWLAALADPDVIAQIRADEENFLERGTTRMWVIDRHSSPVDDPAADGPAPGL